MQREIEKLQRTISELQDKPATKVEVTVPPQRKLSKFNGVDIDVADWVDDATNAIAGLSEKDQVTFIKRHLEGDARKEVSLQPSSKIKTALEIFGVLKAAFGERRTAAKLKKLLYSRTQKDAESVRDFTRTMMGLAKRLPNEDEASRNKMLNEAVCENLKSQTLRDEARKLVDADINTPFTDVRSKLILLGDRDVNDSNVQASTVSSVTEDETECPISKLSAAMTKPVESQQQLVTLLQRPALDPMTTDRGEASAACANPVMLQYPTTSYPAATVSPQQAFGQPWLCNVGAYAGHPGGRAPFRNANEVQCFRCGNFGHIQTSSLCPLYQGPSRFRRRRGGGQQGAGNMTSIPNNSSNQENFSSPPQ